MPECGNCGRWVSHAYVKLADLDEDGKPKACPECGLTYGCLEGKIESYYEPKGEWC